MLTLSHSRAAAIATALLAGACGNDKEAEDPRELDAGHLDTPGSVAVVRWVGGVDETDVRVALIAGRGKARLYFAGGAESYANATRWFDVAYDGGEHIELEEEAWRVHAHLTLGGLVGEVVLGDDVTRSVRAEEVEGATLAGLYEGTADCGRLGLIVTQANKDAPPTAQGACTSSTGNQTQRVLPTTPITSEAGKIRVRTPGGDGAATLLLQAATLEPL